MWEIKHVRLISAVWSLAAQDDERPGLEELQAAWQRVPAAFPRVPEQVATRPPACRAMQRVCRADAIALQRWRRLPGPSPSPPPRFKVSFMSRVGLKSLPVGRLSLLLLPTQILMLAHKPVFSARLFSSRSSSSSSSNNGPSAPK